MDRGVPREAHAECLAAALPRGVAQRELEALGRELGWSGDQLRTPALRQNEGPGNVLMATLAFEHVSEVITVFGERGVSAEHVAHDLAREVRAFESGTGALGEHLADQWMLPLALALWQAGGTAHFTCDQLTDHSTTNMGVIEKFLPVTFDAQRHGAAWRVTAARP
jgi:RNA 3'-terminal phosphate cyclase (ATP)